MSIRNMLFSAAFGIASLTAAHAEGLRPIEGKSIDLGGISGIAYYTVQRDGTDLLRDGRKDRLLRGLGDPGDRR